VIAKERLDEGGCQFLEESIFLLKRQTKASKRARPRQLLADLILWIRPNQEANFLEPVGSIGQRVEDKWCLICLLDV
jgi:hypothetical protein